MASGLLIGGARGFLISGGFADPVSSLATSGGETEASYDYGVLGVGEIASAIVTGLCEDVASAPRILLCPRNRERSARLASRYQSVSVAGDNQSVVNGCSVLLLSIRPQDAPAGLEALSFRADQAIISVMAGVSLSALERLVAPARDIARAIPTPSVIRRAGVTPIHPPTEAAQTLFARLGQSTGVEEVTAFEAMFATTATISAQLGYLAAISQWLSAQGVPREQASRYVSSIFVGLADPLREGSADLEQLVRSHETRGGINERFYAMLAGAGVFNVVAQSLQTIYEQLQTPQLTQPDDPGNQASIDPDSARQP